MSSPESGLSNLSGLASLFTMAKIMNLFNLPLQDILSEDDLKSKEKSQSYNFWESAIEHKYPKGTFINRLDLKPEQYLKFAKRLAKGMIYRHHVTLKWDDYFDNVGNEILEHIPVSGVMPYNNKIKQHKMDSIDIDFIGIVPKRGTEIFILKITGNFSHILDNQVICFHPDSKDKAVVLLNKIIIDTLKNVLSNHGFGWPSSDEKNLETYHNKIREKYIK